MTLKLKNLSSQTWYSIVQVHVFDTGNEEFEENKRAIPLKSVRKNKTIQFFYG